MSDGHPLDSTNVAKVFQTDNTHLDYIFKSKPSYFYAKFSRLIRIHKKYTAIFKNRPPLLMEGRFT